MTDVPPKLFKFRPGKEHDIANLANAKLWVSDPAVFNDPFDCALNAEVGSITDRDCDAILARMYGLNKEKEKQSLQKKFARLGPGGWQMALWTALRQAASENRDGVKGVCCLCAVYDNLLMWSHYAQGHQGFCLEFDTTRDKLFSNARRVEYVDKFPQLRVQKFLEDDNWEHVNRLVLTKAVCWGYEHEWRLLNNEANCPISYDRNSLTAVYCGAKMSDDTTKLLVAALRGTATELYRMRLSKGAFKLVAEKLKIDPSSPRP